MLIIADQPQGSVNQARMGVIYVVMPYLNEKVFYQSNKRNIRVALTAYITAIRGISWGLL